MQTTPWQTVSAVQLYEIESKQRSGIALTREQYIKHKVLVTFAAPKANRQLANQCLVWLRHADYIPVNWNFTWTIIDPSGQIIGTLQSPTSTEANTIWNNIIWQSSFPVLASMFLLCPLVQLYMSMSSFMLVFVCLVRMPLVCHCACCVSLKFLNLWPAIIQELHFGKLVIARSRPFKLWPVEVSRNRRVNRDHRQR